jgi:hypothetical protein
MSARLSALRAGRPPFTTRKIPCTHFCWRLSRSQGHCGAGRIRSIVNPVTSSEIETATSRLVAYCLYLLRYSVPPSGVKQSGSTSMSRLLAPKQLPNFTWLMNISKVTKTVLIIFIKKRSYGLWVCFSFCPRSLLQDFPICNIIPVDLCLLFLLCFVVAVQVLTLLCINLLFFSHSETVSQKTVEWECLR